MACVALVASACAQLYESEPVTSTTTSQTVVTIATEESAQQRVSPDGRLHLEVPAGYPLVTVEGTAIDPATIDDPFEVLGAYDLGPDGTVFADPVIITFDTFLPAAGPSVPIIGLFTGEPGDWVLEGGYRVDATGPTVVVTARIHHFSQVLFTRDLARTFEVDPPSAMTTAERSIDTTWSLIDRCPSMGAIDIAAPVEEHCTYRSALSDNLALRATSVGSGTAVVEHGTSQTAFPRESPSVTAQGWVAATGHSTVTCSGEGTGGFGVEVAMTSRPDIQMVAPNALMRLMFGVADARSAASLAIDQTYVLPVSALRCAASTQSDVLAAVVALGADGDDAAAMLDGVATDRARDLILPTSPERVVRVLDAGSVDIIQTAGFVAELDRSMVVRLFDDATFACGEIGAHEFATVCTDDVALMPSGSLLVLATIHTAPIGPIDEIGSATYGAFFETNGDPSDDLTVPEGADWDFGQGTDRRYRIVRTVDGWTMTLNGGAVSGPSSARALVKGSTVVWVIPLIEIGDTPLVRTTALIDDGSGERAGAAGDVHGQDPTGPLLPILP